MIIDHDQTLHSRLSTHHRRKFIVFLLEGVVLVLWQERIQVKTPKPFFAQETEVSGDGQRDGQSLNFRLTTILQLLATY